MKHNLLKPKFNSISGASRSTFHDSRSGQALIEALVAMSVLSIGFMGIFHLLSQSLALNRVVSSNYVGSYLAGEGIEVVKNIIDSNIVAAGAGSWKSGLGDGNYEVQYNSAAVANNQNRFILYDSNTHLYGYGSGSTTMFKRVVTIENLSAREMKVKSKVTWTGYGGGASEVEVEDHFYNWRP